MVNKSITKFSDNGRDGSGANLFTNAMSTMPDGDFLTLYGALTPVLAKQFVNLPDTPANPLTTEFISEAINYGDVIEDIYIDATPMGATKYRPDATDELGFADASIRVQYSTINVMNTGKVSRYMNEINKASLNANVAGSIGDGIVQGLRVGQVACLENQIGKVLVSSIPPKNNVYCGVESTDSDAQAIVKERKKIIEVCMDMSKVNGSYNDTGYEGTAAREILVIAPKEKWAELIMDKSGVYHPEYLMFDEFKKLGVTIKPIAVDKIETPVTSDEATAYKTASGVEWEDAPGIGQKKPDYIICDRKYLRVNPFIDRYQMFTKDVVSGVPYVNFFLHMQNAISYQPNRKAVRVYVGEAFTATFKDSAAYESAILKKIVVEANEPIVYTDVPVHEGATFDAWSPAFTSGTTTISADTTFTATYTSPGVS